jgi:hypothetical protein
LRLTNNSIRVSSVSHWHVATTRSLFFLALQASALLVHIDFEILQATIGASFRGKLLVCMQCRKLKALDWPNFDRPHRCMAPSSSWCGLEAHSLQSSCTERTIVLWVENGNTSHCHLISRHLTIDNDAVLWRELLYSKS